MTLYREIYKKAQELMVMAMQNDNKELLTIALNLGILADKMERKANAKGRFDRSRDSILVHYGLG